MKVFHESVPPGAGLRSPKATLGTFDGVHRGHQAVLRELVSWARMTDADALVITFDRKPRAALTGAPVDLITSPAHRLRLLESLGVDAVLRLTFDRRLALREPEDFVRDVLVGQIGASGVLLGHDTRFGHGGRGDLQLLRRLGETLGFQTCSVPVVELDSRPVSSTRVREAIQAGNLAEVERLLGRRFSLLGTVVPGMRRGKEIGFPTANLDLHREVQPPEGVYATEALVDGVWHDSATNVGRAPTLRPQGPAFASDQVIVETHLFDFQGDLYGKEMEVRFIDFIRPEQVFDSPKALARRIAEDVVIARKRLAAHRNAGGRSA